MNFSLIFTGVFPFKLFSAAHRATISLCFFSHPDFFCSTAKTKELSRRQTLIHSAARTLSWSSSFSLFWEDTWTPFPHGGAALLRRLAAQAKQQLCLTKIVYEKTFFRGLYFITRRFFDLRRHFDLTHGGQRSH